jgi:hypothetical protein
MAVQHQLARILALAAILPVMGVAGCAHRVAPPADALFADLGDLSLPLDVQELDVASADSARGVFIKLSRIPDGVEHHALSSPASIVLDIKGPTGTDAPEEILPGRDALVSRVRISRYQGVLRVTLDLERDTPPAYSVHMMADWIMVRLGEPGGALFEPLERVAGRSGPAPRQEGAPEAILG